MSDKYPTLIFLILLINRSASGMIHEIVKQFDSNYNDIMTFRYNNSTEIVIDYPESNSKNSFTVTTWVNSKTCPKFPAIVVVRHDREVLSWQVPFPVYTRKVDEPVHFDNTSRTLCPTNMYKNNNRTCNPSVSTTQNFNVALSTSSIETVDISVVVREEEDFLIETNQTYSIVVSPSQPKYAFYDFSDNRTDTVLIEIVSKDDVDLTISVQDSFCPVFDLNEDITFQGKYHTVSRKGGQSIRRKDFPHGFFLVFVAHVDKSECTLDKNMNLWMCIENVTSAIDFIITEDINGDHYKKASGITLGVFFGFCVFSALMVVIFTKCGSVGKLRKRNHPDNITLGEDLRDHRDEAQIAQLLHSQELPLAVLARYPKSDNRKTFNYLWHIFSIAVFYSIPVVQLLLSYQWVVNHTGDQDICYYNFLCAHPAYGLSDFNHIFSNVGYLFTGLLFIAVTYYRHYIVTKSPGSKDFGIPVHDGLYYAMGVALIVEGLLSACYHICPSQTHFQFDTSFMFVMLVLCMVKLYQNRHPDVNASAYATFAVLGSGIFVVMIGLLHGILVVWIVFAIVHTIFCIYISFKIYFFTYVLTGLKHCRTEWQNAEGGFKEKMRTLKPLKKPRFRILVIANVLNFSFVIAGLIMYEDRTTNIGSFLLYLLMANAVLYTLFYSAMKLVHGERICVEAIFYFLVMVFLWIPAVMFFTDHATLSSVTPAESRQKNQPCIWLNFYDTHDVWHFLSAGALYFTFMYLQSLDGDIIGRNRDLIVVF